MYNNILAPIILDGEHDTDASFSAARTLASPEAAFTVLHVMEAIQTYARAEVPGNILADKQQEMAHALTEAAKGLAGSKAQLISGHSGQAILNYAEANDIDYIIIASHRPGLEDYFLGSTASRVVRHATCAVQVMR